MIFKLVHCFILLSYLNILAYEAGTGAPAPVSFPILNGESILEFVLDDVLEIPIDKDTADIQIMYDEYRIIANNFHLIPLFILLTGIVFSIWLLADKVKHPIYDGKKRHIVLGYASHLHRLKLY